MPAGLLKAHTPNFVCDKPEKEITVNTLLHTQGKHKMLHVENTTVNVPTYQSIHNGSLKGEVLPR